MAVSKPPTLATPPPCPFLFVCLSVSVSLCLFVVIRLSLAVSLCLFAFGRVALPVCLGPFVFVRKKQTPKTEYSGPEGLENGCKTDLAPIGCLEDQKWPFFGLEGSRNGVAQTVIKSTQILDFGNFSALPRSQKPHPKNRA